MYLAGVTGFVNVKGGPQYMGKWKMSGKTNMVKVNNFVDSGSSVAGTSAPPSSNFASNSTPPAGSGVTVLVAGLSSATINIEGPYNSGTVGLYQGGYYLFNLGFAAGLFLTVGAIIESMDFDNDIEGGPRVNITAQSTGTFVLLFA
jgi:hypothetical protein